MTNKIPWGEIGYITYKRTYSRKLNELDPNSKTEEFEDTVNRELNACKTQLGLNFTQQEIDLYKQTRLALKWSVNSQPLQKVISIEKIIKFGEP